jgi:hypothetical protein
MVSPDQEGSYGSRGKERAQRRQHLLGSLLGAGDDHGLQVVRDWFHPVPGLFTPARPHRVNVLVALAHLALLGMHV